MIGLLLGFVVASLFFAFLTGIFAGEGDTKAIMTAMVTIVLFVFCLCIAIGIDDNYSIRGYKQGQIDALTGNVHYKLETQVDSTKVWVEVK